jgi:radical SAM protein with 4Fe4S-binding SPASM domain
MLNIGMAVSIRLNCGLHNTEDLKSLIVYLSEEYKDVPNLSVYVHELFDLSNSRKPEDSKRIFENMMEIEDLLTEKGFRIENWSTPESIKTIHCMVDSDESVIISPTGELGLCEHYQNSKFYGHINNPAMKDMDVIRGWRNYSEYTEICEDCPLKPICLKLKDCPDHKICDIWEKNYVLKRNSEDVKLIYNNWQKRMLEEQQNNETDNKCTCKKEIEQ